MRLHLLWLILLALPASAEPARPVLTLPMDVYSHGLYLRVSVNNSPPLQFQFDSAAGWHVINWPVAEAAQLKLKGHPSGAQGAGDSRVSAAQVLEASIRLGALDLPFTPAAAIQLDFVSDRKGITLDGLLGAPLLKSYVVETNVDEGKFRLYDPANWEYNGSGQELAVRVDGMGVPHLTAPVRLPDGRTLEAEFKVDSAAGGTTVFFAAPYARKHRLLEAIDKSGGRRLADEVGGVGGTSLLWIVRIPGIQLGKWKFENFVAGITEAQGGTLAGNDIAGIIGGGLLHRFNVIYDCPRNRIFIEPAKGLKEPFEEDMSGIRWLNVGPGRKEFRVRTVRPGSPAERAGIQGGDILLRVNGQLASGFDRSSLTRVLRQHGRQIRLDLRRGEQDIKAEFRLERMI